MTADLSALDIERRLTAIEATLPTFATKADIHSLRADIQVMRSEWKSDLGEMKAEFGAMKGDLNAREARLIKWTGGLVVAGAAAAAGVAIAVNKVFGTGFGGSSGAAKDGTERTRKARLDPSWQGHRAA